MNPVLRQMFGPPPVQLVPGSGGDILVFSMRRVADLAAYCLQYEFEDIIVDVTGADRVEPTRLELVEFKRKVYKALNSASSAKLARSMTPTLGGFRLDKTYDLFLPIFNHPYEVFALNAVPDWRKRCRYAACVITEVWESALPEYLLQSLADFDRIYLCSNPVESVARITGRPVSYLPLGIDAIRFCPFPDPPRRSIDVLGIGRRSVMTHVALMQRARDRDFFYYYDTIRTTAGVADAAQQITFSVSDPAEHRFKLASMLKRSRYYLASRARANEDDPSYVDELSNRFFEGAASGAVMIGEPPASGKYLMLFDWPDAVVKTPFDAPNIGEVIAELEADPARRVRIRRDNMVNTLLRHDFAYRVRTVLGDAGMAPPPGLLAREVRLRELADMVSTGPIAP